MIIRDAVEEDLPGILTIVNDVIAASTAIWRDSLETPEERRAWLVERQSRGFPVLVAVDRTGVLASRLTQVFAARKAIATASSTPSMCAATRAGGASARL